MPFDVDFLAVGDGARSGDALALRYGNLSSQQTVVVIDGGTQESGEKIVEHVKHYYNSNRADIVISTHPDSDHISGLSVVLEKLEVGNLLMHKPWEHAEDIRSLFVDDLLTARGLEIKLARALQGAKNLEKIAKRKNIPITEPFEGVHTADNSLLVLGPSKTYFQSLLCNFRCTPQPKESSTFLSTLLTKAGEAVTWVQETLGQETLDDLGITSAENNSSAIVLLRQDNESLLFTGDAGIPALTNAADYAASQGINLSGLRFFQVPHHGSRRNLGPTILNRLTPRTAFISVCCDGAPKHPSRKVTNALRRRGASPYATKGLGLWHNLNGPVRSGWSAVEPLPFYDQVEA
jgi:beta-lactamase superfamily II metal-dependent hydrolase